jgi:hypothetical protein
MKKRVEKVILTLFELFFDRNKQQLMQPKIFVFQEFHLLPYCLLKKFKINHFSSFFALHKDIHQFAEKITFVPPA